MAATAQEYLSLANQIIAEDEQVLAGLDRVEATIASIDPKSPDAQSKLSQASSERDQLRARYNDSIRPKVSQLNSLYDSASSAVQNEVSSKRSQVSSITDAVISGANSTKASLDQKRKEIDQAKQQPQQATGSANAAPGSTTTANTSPITSGSGQPAPTTGNAGNNAVKDDKGNPIKPAANQQPPTGAPGDQKPVPGPAGPTTPTNNAVQEKPGKRLFNPLGEYPSYTYQISLYIISPDAYDAFINSGRKDINALRNADAAVADAKTSGAFLLVQSGGITNDATRAEGFELDYYIDDLKIVTATSGKDTMTATNVTDITFKIVEPYGFSFISNLKRASEQLLATSKAPNITRLQNATKQFFMLGIRFQGLDGNGRPITSKETTNGINERAGSGENGIYERFYDIIITNIGFKLDGKATVYNIQARSLAPGTALGVAKGVHDIGQTLQGSKVGDLLNELATGLNLYSAKQAQYTGSTPDTYEFSFIGTEEDIASLKDATIVTNADLDKLTWAGSNAKTTAQSNAATAENATPQAAKRTFIVEPGEPIVQAVQRLISQSSYLEKALISVQKNSLQPVKDGKTNEQAPGQASYVSWYNLSVECTNFKYDTKFAKFSCHTKFVIQTYQTPVIQNAYTELGVPYYGPHKRYQYYFTGQNTEVLSYTQNLDNTYFNVALLPPDQTTPSAATGGDAAVTTIPGKGQAAPKSGKYPLGAEAISAYMTDLYDPKAYAEAKLVIMGDPDYLMPDQSSSVNEVYNRFYNSDGFTINANGGQVFIEIDFKEARDYGWKRTGVTNTGKITGTELTNRGVMEINESIRFWRYPDKIAAMVKGVSYMVRSVTSIFSGGAFRQELDLNINTFPGTTEEQNSQPAPTTPPQASQPVGTPTAPPVNPAPAPPANPPTPAATPPKDT